MTVRIRQKILSGAYAPGAPLLQDLIAAEFGTSKIPVREALLSLRAEGLVDIFAHRGFQVRPLEISEMQEVHRLRLDIEPAAAARGARVATPTDVSTARSALTALNDALSKGELTDAGDLNCAFHLSLIVPHLNPVTSQILGRLHTLSQRYVRLHLTSAVGRVKRANREHSAIYVAWAGKKDREVARLVRAHIEETSQELADALKR